MRSNLFGIVGIILLIILIVVSQSLFIVDETKQAMVLQFGEPIRTLRESGLATKLPFIQNVVYFEKRILSSDAPAQEYLTIDKKRLLIDHITRWRIVDPLVFFKAARTEARAQARLDDIVFSELRRELAIVAYDDIISDQRENIMDRVSASAAETAAEFGIEVVNVRIKRADLPEEVEQSVFDRMRAERQRESSLYRAEGEEQANIIRARADRARIVSLAEGRQEAQKLRGEGEAAAIAIYAEALSQDPEFYAFTRRLEAYATVLKRGDKLVIPSDSDFFRYIINSTGGIYQSQGE